MSGAVVLSGRMKIPRFPARLLLWVLVVGGGACGVLLFPRVWFTQSDPDVRAVWFRERTNAPGWTFGPLSVTESEERQLAADTLFMGAFSGSSGQGVVLFSACRFNENPHQLGLFVHTPDFCWSQVGWRMENGHKDVVAFELHGVPVSAERRVFLRSDGRRELVYFFGLVGGQPLRSRLNHNYAIALRSAVSPNGVSGAPSVAGFDPLIWRRLWDAFRERRQLLGPKQFVRVSTPVSANGDAAGDAFLQRALTELLEPVPFLEGGHGR